MTLTETTAGRAGVLLIMVLLLLVVVAAVLGGEKVRVTSDDDVVEEGGGIWTFMSLRGGGVREVTFSFVKMFTLFVSFIFSVSFSIFTLLISMFSVKLVLSVLLNESELSVSLDDDDVVEEEEEEEDEDDDDEDVDGDVMMTSGEKFLMRMYVTERMTEAMRLWLAPSMRGMDPLS